MKKYEERTKPESKYKALVEIKCDICGEVTKSKWRQNASDATEVNVSLKTGFNTSDGGQGEDTTIDICPNCFTTKLIPWAKSQGAQPMTESWEW